MRALKIHTYKFTRPALCLAVICIAAMFAACKDDEAPAKGEYGTVATVNGRGISLQQLQAKHDFNNLSWSASAMPSADELQRQYGVSLTELIIAELMAQELEKRDLAVSDAELKAAEDEVRADYPDDEFERSLVEDYIDIEIWRALLRHRLAMLKFISTVLRPEITISPADMEAYYQAHIAEFTLPRRQHFIVVDCESKATAEKLRKAYVQTKSQPLPTEDDIINVREITANQERLPQAWIEALVGLKSREASEIKSNEQRYQFLIFLETLPEQVLDLASVYSRVEAGLVEVRIESAFNHWLDKQLAKADIRVSRPLLEAWDKPRGRREALPEDVGSQIFGNITEAAPDEYLDSTDEDANEAIADLPKMRQKP